jgi:hypothetical protein
MDDKNNDSLEKRASFWDSKAIAHNLIGGALLLMGQWLLAGVPTMIAGLIAFAAWFGGLPLYAALIIGVLIFLVASIALYVIERARSVRKDRKERPRPESLPALRDELDQANVEIFTLRAEVNELNEAIRKKATQLNETHRQLTQSEIEKDDVRRALETAESERDNLKKERDGLETERNQLSESLEPMNQLQIGDKSEVKNLVLVCGVLCRKATEGPAHLDFTFSILNMSLYVISVESIEGYIGFHRDAILYKPKVPPRLESNSARNVAFRKTGHFLIEQHFLTEGETDYVLNAPKDSIHSLRPLKIIVTGDGLEPTQLADLDKIFVKQDDDPWLNHDERYFFSSGIAAQKAKEEIDNLKAAFKVERRELESALEAERGRNASPRFRTEITHPIRINGSYDTSGGGWYCELSIGIEVWNDSPKAAAIRGYKCKLIMGGQEFEAVPQPLRDDFQVMRERLETHSYEPTRTLHPDKPTDLSVSNGTLLTDGEHRPGWLSFFFSSLPSGVEDITKDGRCRYSDDNIKQEGCVRLGVIDNKGNIHWSEPYPISGDLDSRQTHAN